MTFSHAGKNGYGNEANGPTKLKFSPRIGFAWNAQPKTTIRGGYGLFWAPYTFSLVNPLGYTFATPYVDSNDGNATPANSLSNPFPAGVGQFASGQRSGPLGGLGQHVSRSSITTTLPPACISSLSTFSVKYRGVLYRFFMATWGSITHDLIAGTPLININQLPDSDLSLGSKLSAKVPNPFFGTSAGVLNLASATVTQAQLLFPYPEFGAISEQDSNLNHASYNAFYVKAQKRLGRSVNILTTYTKSRNMDESNAGVGNAQFAANLRSGQLQPRGGVGTGEHRHT